VINSGKKLIANVYVLSTFLLLWFMGVINHFVLIKTVVQMFDLLFALSLFCTVVIPAYKLERFFQLICL